jgi:hypothetical protein
MIRSIEKINNLIGNRTRNLPACSIVPQATTQPRWCVNFNVYLMVLLSISVLFIPTFRLQWLALLPSVSLWDQQSQFPRWTRGSDARIHRLAFRSHLTTTASLTLSPSHILRAFSVSLLQDVMRLQISSETGIEQHYRTVRAKTFPSHSITLLYQ